MAEIDLNEADEAIVDELREGRNTPSNLARNLGYSREYVSQRLKRLTEHGVVEKVDRGLYELAEDPAANTRREAAPAPPREDEGRPDDPTPATGEEAGSSDESAPTDAEGILRDLGLPGSGDDLEARIQAVVSMYEYLRDHPGERVETNQLKELAADHPLGYRDVDSFWSNFVKKNAAQGRPNALLELPGVREAGEGEYVYEAEGD